MVPTQLPHSLSTKRGEEGEHELGRERREEMKKEKGKHREGGKLANYR